MSDYTPKDIDRFFDKISRPYGTSILEDMWLATIHCWVWTAAFNKQTGKPVFYHNGKLKHATKVAHELQFGKEVGKNRKFIKTCDNPECVSPFHHHPDTLRNKIIFNTEKGKYIKRLESYCLEWTGNLSPDGYGVLSHKNKNIRAHRAVMIVKHGEIPEDSYVCHHCDNKKCVNPEHLYFGTPKENTQDAIERGQKQIIRGENCTWSRLTADNIRDIRQRAANGEPQTEIAKSYNVHQSHVNKIIHRRVWKHID